MLPGGLRALLGLARFTWPWNLAATPALSLPWGWSEAGLPLAVQLVAAVGRDAELLSVARVIESDPLPRASHA